ncbi:abscisic acid receptor PYL4-like [Lolium rigidum]|uniref:abscisic acid receptor PYL4-like n=1 Tax=Lolium rigidum TaxID=89674 RepID=UPI001F5D2E58|nr:abscisic acid receptor PYL4-like [Lolium rigidum]XP_051227028.1 abscisic acid receptor PYL4-like [Lolium perenne]
MPYTAVRPSPQQHSRIGGASRKALVAHGAAVPGEVARYHEHAAGAGQCCSAVVQAIAAPAEAVWSVVRRFDRPQAYKHFIKSCRLVDGDGGAVGSVREVRVVSGMPGTCSRERLEILDDERRVLSFRIVGGEHRLANYRSVTTVNEVASTVAGAPLVTLVVESYVVDVPPGNTSEETRMFVDTIVRCNLQSLARMAEELALAVPLAVS